MRSFEFIEMYMLNNNLKSDYETAGKLKISRASMCNYRKGRPIDDDIALIIAESIGIKVYEILYIIRAEKARDEKTRKAWLALSTLNKEGNNHEKF